MMTGSYRKAERTARQSMTLAVALGLAALMFLIAGALFGFVLADSYESFVVRWRLIFASIVGVLWLAAGITIYYAARSWKAVRK